MRSFQEIFEEVFGESVEDAPNYRKSKDNKICKECSFARGFYCEKYKFAFEKGYTCDSFKQKTN